MIARLLAASLVLGAIVSVLSIGPGQFGYAYMGMIAGFAAIIKITIDSVEIIPEVLMIAAPLGAIVIGMVFMLWTAFTMVILTFRMFVSRPVEFLRWSEFLLPFVLSVAMLAGLWLFRAIPGTGTDDDLIVFSNDHFYYPVALAIGSVCLKIADRRSPNQGRQATASPSPAA